MGPGAGAGLTTGSGNVVLGRASLDPAAQETIVLSTGTTGAVRARWDAGGAVQLAVPTADAVPDPPAGYATLGYDAVAGQLAFRYRDGPGALHTCAFRSDDSIQTLTALTDATTGVSGATSLIDNAAAHRLHPGGSRPPGEPPRPPAAWRPAAT